jgi:hypothetical protein
MKKTLLASLFVAVQAYTVTPSNAQAPAGAPASAPASAPSNVSADQAKLEELLHVPPGVTPEFENGVLKRAYIVVSVPLSTSMQPAYAKKLAFTKASVQAAGIFVKWLKETVRSATVNNEQVLEQRQGENNANGATTSEQNKATSSTSDLNTAEAEGLARGIVSRTYQIKDGELTAIYGWSPKLSQAASQAEIMTQAGSTPAPAQATQTAPTQPEAASSPSQPVKGNVVQPVPETRASSSNLSDF